MSFQFDKQHFANARPLPVVVLVDPCRHWLEKRRGIAHADIAGMLAHCRAALVHARSMGMAVAFVRSPGTGNGPNSDWIKGFEPSRNDMVFERRAASCYANPYFDEIARSSGELVFAGFLGQGGCLSTAADAIRAGTRITFLDDATVDHASARVFGDLALAEICEFTHFEIHSIGTHKWIASTGAQMP